MNELLEAVIPFLNTLQETLSGARQGALPEVPDSPALEVGAQEAGGTSSIKHNESLEASMRNRVVKLESKNSIFLLDKGRGEYWSEVKTALNNCASQKDYNRLLEFENRDLQIREGKHECYSLFQGVLSQHPALAENAAYSPKEAFVDFFNEKRDKSTEWDPAKKDKEEIEFVDQVKQDLRTRGPESSYMRQLLGYEEE